MAMQEKKSPSRTKRVKKPKKISQSYLRHSGIYYLQRYTASVSHFRSVMTRKIKRSLAEHKAPDIDQCMDWLDDVIRQFEEDGLLNDREYARGLLISLRRRGLSASSIRMKMAQKGPDSELVQNSLESTDNGLMDAPSYAADIIMTHGLPDVPDYRAAITFAKKKRLGPFSRHNAQEDEKLFKRQLSAFARAGFSYDIASAVMAINLTEPQYA